MQLLAPSLVIYLQPTSDSVDYDEPHPPASSWLHSIMSTLYMYCIGECSPAHEVEYTVFILARSSIWGVFLIQVVTTITRKVRES